MHKIRICENEFKLYKTAFEYQSVVILQSFLAMPPFYITFFLTRSKIHLNYNRKCCNIGW